MEWTGSSSLLVISSVAAVCHSSSEQRSSEQRSSYQVIICDCVDCGVTISSHVSLDQHVSSTCSTCFYWLRRIHWIWWSLDTVSVCSVWWRHWWCIVLVDRHSRGRCRQLSRVCLVQGYAMSPGEHVLHVQSSLYVMVCANMCPCHMLVLRIISCTTGPVCFPSGCLIECRVVQCRVVMLWAERGR